MPSQILAYEPREQRLRIPLVRPSVVVREEDGEQVITISEPGVSVELQLPTLEDAQRLALLMVGQTKSFGRR